MLAMMVIVEAMGSIVAMFVAAMTMEVMRITPIVLFFTGKLSLLLCVAGGVEAVVGAEEDAAEGEDGGQA